MRFVIVIVVLLALLVPGVLAAQGELTLEGLAEQVTGLAERVESIEQLYSPDAVRSGDGACTLARHKALHPSTVAAYQALFDNQVPDTPRVELVRIIPDVGTSIIIEVDGWNDIYVEEIWSGCEFQSHSLFWEEDYSGNIIYLE